MEGVTVLPGLLVGGLEDAQQARRLVVRQDHDGAVRARDDPGVNERIAQFSAQEVSDVLWILKGMRVGLVGSHDDETNPRWWRFGGT